MKKIQHELSESQQFKTLIKEPVIKELFLYKDSSDVSYLTTDTLLIQQHIRECFIEQKDGAFPLDLTQFPEQNGLYRIEKATKLIPINDEVFCFSFDQHILTIEKIEFCLEEQISVDFI